MLPFVLRKIGWRNIQFTLCFTIAADHITWDKYPDFYIKMARKKRHFKSQTKQKIVAASGDEHWTQLINKNNTAFKNNNWTSYR